MLIISLSYIYPSIVLPPSLLLGQFQCFILLFLYMNTKYIHHIHPHSSFPYALPHPTAILSQKRCFTLLSFIFQEGILIVQRGLALMFQVCVCFLPPFTYSFCITKFPYYSIMVLYYNTFIHR
jgi:hypothetical protein